MKAHCVIFSTLFVLSLILVPPSQASLVSVDDAVFGAGSVTRDTATNLEWLDVSKTASTNRNYVLAQLGAGGAFAGWHYATGAEVIGLLTAAGIPIGYGLTDPAVFTAVANFAALVGSTKSQNGYPEVLAQIGDGKRYGADFTYSDGNPSYNTGDVGGTSGGALTYSSWLVRETAPVPIPGAVWLLGSGLLGLIGIRGRGRR